jgi:DNA-binding GntR family transcriptional regulator
MAGKSAERPTFSAPEISSRSSADDAARYIRRLIFDGELRGGMRIPQDDIAAALGRSRVPVREALIALEREGWVTVVLNRGAYVASFTPEAILDHYELLAFAFGLAARRAVANDVPTLDERLAELAVDLRDIEDLDRFSAAAIAFHAAIIDAADSPRIRSVLRAMSAIVPGNFFEQVPDSASIVKRGTATIRKAIADRDGARAAHAYQAMLRRHAELVVDLLDGRGFFEEPASLDVEPEAS